jgi:hydrogenase maturation protein HypF
MDRRAISVQGIVQGVGFRPFVYSLAARLGLHGFVQNRTGTVLIEVEGETSVLDRFLTELSTLAPPLAQIDDIHWSAQSPRGDADFRIQPSEAGAAGQIFISPDIATCPDCLAELVDPTDPRYLYPFLNCTNCGPRLTIITGAPYDRECTTMKMFPMCPRCRAEYDDPANRRFHAQPTACAVCGPRLILLDAQGTAREEDPLTYTAEALKRGLIGAVKSLGGYHLACRAEARVVAELRRRKHRDEKPFALMVKDLAAARQLCEVGPAEEKLLLSPRRPIVLLRRRPGTAVAEEVAPRNPTLGVMLPYTPLHYLLMRAVDGLPLVMTSGNRSDEPIVYEDGEALPTLGTIADFFLTNDRPIYLRCDDSVTRVVAGLEMPIRRSRGYAPQPLTLPFSCPQPLLALGGQLKATFALAQGRHAFLSHHLGDLDHYAAYRAFEEAIDHYERLFDIEPRVLVHDLHPEYASTRYAAQRAGRSGVKLVAVQHHHAHLASCMAEHGLRGPVIGVSFDGTGYGTDGAIWGGEFLTGDYRGFHRAAHFRYVPLPGGDQAIREPWRMAVSCLVDAEEERDLLRERVSRRALATIERMIERRFLAPLTSSAGRLFDAVSALAGIRQSVSYEGQAAMELEWLAAQEAPAGVYPFEVAQEQGEAAPGLLLDFRPLIRAVCADVRGGVASGIIARRFQTTLVEAIACVCQRIRKASGLTTVVLTGGVFLNVLLTTETTARLTADGFQVYRQQRVPPNDGGLSLGQLAIAAQSPI